MSVRLWAYESWKCDGDYCVNRCDICKKANLESDDTLSFIEEESDEKNDKER